MVTVFVDFVDPLRISFNCWILFMSYSIIDCLGDFLGSTREFKSIFISFGSMIIDREVRLLFISMDFRTFLPEEALGFTWLFVEFVVLCVVFVVL